MRALVVGLGSIGRRHVANLKQIDPACEIVVWHHNDDGALATQPDFAVVSNPSSAHVATALELAERGIHLLVEKPLSNSLESVDRLLDACRSRGVKLLVGYTYRFSDSLQKARAAIREGRIGKPLLFRSEVGQYLPDWRPESDYRSSVTARRELGGGVLLELSHELDYVRWLGGEVREVSARMAHLSDLETDVEDTAVVHLSLRDGAMASITLNMFQRVPSRTCQVLGSEGTLTWDGLTHEVRCYDAPSGKWSELHPADTSARSEMYVAELRHFLDCVYRGATPLISGEEGRRMVEVVLAAKQSSDERRVVMV